MNIFFNLIKKIAVYSVTLILVTWFLFIFLYFFANRSNNSFFQHFLTYFQNFFAGNFGSVNNTEVIESSVKIDTLFFNSLTLTFAWTFISFLISLIFSFFLAYIASTKKTNFWSFLIKGFNSLLSAIPILILVAVFFLINIFLEFPTQFLANANPSKIIISILVPVVILVISITPLMFFTILKILNEIISSGYYIFAKTKGMKAKELFFKVILKTFLLRFLENILQIYLVLFTLAIVLERIFKINGLSLLITYAILYKEADVLMFYFIFSLILIFSFQIFTEIIQEIFDPVNYLSKQKPRWYQQMMFYFKRKLIWK
ncbi:ABC transporter permease subunit [Mycoplasma iguanae]|uniref:ABC transporter permease subunit n=1 Tax=Mycoplasma iguanae TaxID=292461 RepID=A0ABY5R9P3_9MOLU|nr:ABC transporter permease subunit [Mycoplasma iguanae]UVD81504.1 ABC transporter permease subunit [Mycoplasma iguanae]